MEAILAFYAGFRRRSGSYQNRGVGSMNIFKRIRNAYWDFKIGCRYPGIQEAVEKLNNEEAQKRLKAIIAERRARKQRISHLLMQLAALKTEALERGW